MAASLRLVRLSSPTPREYPLSQRKTTIGAADDNDIVIKHASVSRAHAIIVRKMGRFGVQDLESTNGTRVNGQSAKAWTQIESGDELEFGSVRMAAMKVALGPHRRRFAIRTMLEVAGVLLFVSFGATQFLLSRRIARYADTAVTSLAHPPGANSVIESGDPSKLAGPAAHTVRIGPAEAAGRTSLDATEVGPESECLIRLNHYRTATGLEPVRVDPELSSGDFAHARYLVKNYGPLIRGGDGPGAESHSEDPSKPGYSTEGIRAARSGDIAWRATDRSLMPPVGWAIDDWMSGAWHRLWILNPRLSRVGYGEYCEQGLCVAVLDVLSRLGEASAATTAASRPVQYPPEGATTGVRSFDGEWPDPLTSCKGYEAPAGLPITLQLGAMAPAVLTQYSLRHDPGGKNLALCGFDANSYLNPDSGQQARARQVLAELGAVVLVPREPLSPGAYTVGMTVNGHAYQWRFAVR